MKTKLTCVVVFLCVVAVNYAGGQGTAVEEEIRELEQKFNSSYAANDLKTYFSYYASDMVEWLPEGRRTLAEYQKEWADFIGAGNRVEAADMSELMVKVGPSRDSAVAMYTLRARTRLANGKVTEENFQETDVWFKGQGGWKIVALHYSAAPKK